MKHLEVVAAVLVNRGEVLCMQRGISRYDYVSEKYEFPGGKVETGESRPEALMRELREEMDLDLNISEADALTTVDYAYPDFRITLHCFLVFTDTRSFIRREHISHIWLPLERLHDLSWAPADEIVVDRLLDRGIRKPA